MHGVLRAAFLGDIVADNGMEVVLRHIPELRSDHQPHVLIANAENARGGSGLSPSQYRRLRQAGIDGITLGDHAFKCNEITRVLEVSSEPLSRPANLASGAPGKGVLRIKLPPPFEFELCVLTLLGQIFINQPCDNPFQVIDRELSKLPGGAAVIVEAHMEATSEKMAFALHLAGRVAAVLGTHTHIPTADERLLAGDTAFISDLGMCGPYDSVIGRDPVSVIRYFSTGVHTPFQVGRGGEAMCGVIVEIDASTRRARSIRRFRYPKAKT